MCRSAAFKHPLMDIDKGSDGPVVNGNTNVQRTLVCTVQTWTFKMIKIINCSCRRPSVTVGELKEHFNAHGLFHRVTGLLQAAALSGSLITHKISGDMTTAAVLHIHHNMSVTQSTHNNTLSRGRKTKHHSNASSITVLIILHSAIPKVSRHFIVYPQCMESLEFIPPQQLFLVPSLSRFPVR